MIPVTNKQTIIICSLCVTIVAGSVVGIITLEKRRKEFLSQVAKVENKPWDTEWLSREAYEKDKKTKDEFGSNSPDPIEPVIIAEVKDQVDIIVPQSVDQLGSRFAMTKDRKYAIYADLSVDRPGVYENVLIQYWPEDLYFIYNGFAVPPGDIESMFGRSFCEEILSLGLGRDLSLLIYSTEKIQGLFLKIMLTFYEGRVPVEMIEVEEKMEYDPDNPDYSEADDDEFDEEAQDEAIMQEVLDAEEIEASQPFFDHNAPIYIDPIGELDEEDIHEGWMTCEWTHRVKTGLIYDEEGVAVTEEQVLEWLGPELLATVCAPNVLSKFPERVIYIRNGKLKLLYEIIISTD
jgi:hypothetical protein